MTAYSRFSFLLFPFLVLVDEWPIGSPLKFKQHTTLKERAAVAREFIARQGFKIPVVLDDIDNSFENTYAAWPVRFYIVEKVCRANLSFPNCDHDEVKWCFFSR